MAVSRTGGIHALRCRRKVDVQLLIAIRSRDSSGEALMPPGLMVAHLAGGWTGRPYCVERKVATT